MKGLTNWRRDSSRFVRNFRVRMVHDFSDMLGDLAGAGRPCAAYCAPKLQKSAPAKRASRGTVRQQRMEQPLGERTIVSRAWHNY